MIKIAKNHEIHTRVPATAIATLLMSGSAALAKGAAAAPAPLSTSAPISTTHHGGGHDSDLKGRQKGFSRIRYGIRTEGPIYPASPFYFENTRSLKRALKASRSNDRALSRQASPLSAARA